MTSSFEGKLKLLPWLVGLALLMETLDITIINTAIPQMARSLATHPLNLKIAVTSYLLTLAAMIPISGYAADKFGTKKTFMLALCIFLVGSVFCGFSHSVMEIVIGRLIQGLGGGMMGPVARLILLRSFSRKKIAKALSYMAILGQVGPALGPVVGGFLTTALSWRLVFFINIPIGLMTLLFAWLLVRNEQQASAPKFDTLGFVVFGVAAALLIFSLTMLTEHDTHYWLAGLMLASSVGLLIYYVFHALKIPHPVLELRLFKIESFRLAVLGSLVIRIGIAGMPFLLPLLFQINFRLTAFQSGLLLLPLGLGMVLAKPLMSRTLQHVSFRKLLLINPWIIALSILSFSLVNQTTPPLLIAMLTFILGFFCSFQYSAMNILNFADIDSTEQSKAVGLSSVFQRFAATLGVCMGAGLLIINDLFEHQFSISLEAFHGAFIVLAVIAVLSTLIFQGLRKNAGMHLFEV